MLFLYKVGRDPSSFYLVSLKLLWLLLLQWTKESWGEKGLFGLHFHIIVHHSRKPRQELKQGWNREAAVNSDATGECYLVVRSPVAYWNSFLIELETSNLGVAPLTMVWTLPYWSLIKKMPYRPTYNMFKTKYDKISYNKKKQKPSFWRQPNTRKRVPRSGTRIRDPYILTLRNPIKILR